MRKFIKDNLTTIYGVLLWIITAIYTFKNFDSISVNPVNLEFIIFSLLVILSLMPLISEIDLLGFSIKKDLNETKSELKSEILDIREQVLNLNFNSNSNTTNNYYGLMPSEEKLNEADKFTKAYSISSDPSRKSISANIPEDVIELFRIRYNIEQKFKDIYNLLDIINPRFFVDVNKVLNNNSVMEIMKKRGISKDGLSNIKHMISVCNRIIHGEFVDDTYIKYVKSLYPPVMQAVNEIIEDLKK